MVLVGLTGGIGSGKSTVARRLAEHGAVLVDADRIARAVLEPGTPGLAAVVDRFGEQVLTPSGTLDRAALGEVVFSDDRARADLEQITHPLIRVATKEALRQARPEAVVVHDVPLLVERDLSGDYDLVVVVGASPQTRLRRLADTRGMTREDARARMQAQASDEQRRSVADVWIDNDSGLDHLREQVDRLWDRLRNQAVSARR